MENEIIIFSFTDAGSQLSSLLCEAMHLNNMACLGYAKEQYAKKHQLTCIDFNIQQYIKEHWGKSNFLFIGAVGIAVRMIAPYVKDKFTDSAVLAMDEKGEYVIPILSGHMGGAVELAHKIASLCSAIPVITTATDLNEKFAVDVFAKKNHLFITDRVTAKKISAAVLEGSEVELKNDENMITVCVQTDETIQLNLLKIDLVVGIGCKKNISYEILEQNLKTILEKNGLQAQQICSFASIDLKKEEPGLLALSEKYQIPFQTFSVEELSEITDVSSESEFVKRVTGVDNVCERAAWCAAKEGKLVQEKICMDGTTFAIVRNETHINMDKWGKR